MKVYVAGTWENKVFVKEMMNAIEAAGHEITVDWTKHVKSDDAVAYAYEDMNGVLSCEVFVFVDPATMSRGKYTELGMAIAAGKSIIVLINGHEGLDSGMGVFGYLISLYHRANSFAGVIEHLKYISEKKYI